MKRRTFVAACTLPILALVGCSSSSGAPASRDDAGSPSADAAMSAPDAGGDDASASDEAEDAPTYPATHPAVPQVVNLGGPVLTNPKIVPVSFPNDPLQSDIDTFAAAIATTTYWGDVTKEYGIAPATALAPIHVADAVGATIDDTAIQTWLASMLDGTHPEFPAPDANTVYALYYPPGTTVTYDGLGSSCTAFHGYHSNMQLTGGANVVYAVISRCATLPEIPVTGIQYVSAVTSHEVIEAITDPLVMTNPAYAETDDDHIAFTFLSLAELGDMCTLVGNAFYTPTDFPYTVQRIWSNALATAGHDPCVPNALGTTYINSAPVLDDTVSFDVGGQTGRTKGALIPVGSSKTIEIDLFSDGPTTAPWSVAAVEPYGASTLAFTFDKNSGQNGDKLSLTIKALSTNSSYGSSPFIIESTSGTEKNLWVGLVGN